MTEKKYADEAYLQELEKKAERMKAAVRAAKPDLSGVKRRFYVKNNGCDAADGLTPETAWQTLLRVNRAKLEPGDAVLFACGGLWRGDMRGRRGVTYSSFGEGEKPVICGSKQNYADPALWKTTEWKNVWKLTVPVFDVGIVALDHSKMPGGYEEKVGTMRIRGGKDGFMGPADMQNDLDFFSDLSNDDLYLYSKENPGARFFSIEIGENRSLLWMTDDNTVDGLCFAYGGGHATNALTCKHFVARNNIYAWIGGSILLDYPGGAHMQTRYGNAVEIFGGIDGYIVENNWMYQIYDTAVTHQYSGHKPGDCEMKNIRYENNLMELCHWGIEFYDAPHEGTRRSVHDVYMNNNFIRYGGMGWGTVARGGRGLMFCGSSMPEDTRSFVAENNIIDRSERGNLLYLNTVGDRKIEMRHNTYVQYEGALIGSLYGETTPFDDNAAACIREVTGDSKAEVVYVKKES